MSDSKLDKVKRDTAFAWILAIETYEGEKVRRAAERAGELEAQGYFSSWEETKHEYARMHPRRPT